MNEFTFTQLQVHVVFQYISETCNTHYFLHVEIPMLHKNVNSGAAFLMFPTLNLYIYFCLFQKFKCFLELYCNFSFLITFSKMWMLLISTVVQYQSYCCLIEKQRHHVSSQHFSVYESTDCISTFYHNNALGA